MFKKLRNRLMAFNMGVVASILVLLLMILLFAMPEKISWHTEFHLLEIINSGGAFPSDKEDHWNTNKADYFYIKTDRQGRIYDRSTNWPLPEEQIAILAAKTLQTKERQGIIGLDATPKYRFIMGYDAHGMILAYCLLTSEVQLWINHLISYTLVLLAAVVLTGIGSYFMAQRALGPISRSWKRQRDFISEASQELRSPLLSIQTSLQVVLEHPDAPVHRLTKWLESIRQEAVHGEKLISDLLFLTRADSNQLSLSMTPFPFNEAIQTALVPYEGEAAKKNVHFTLNLDLPFEYTGDKARIKQMAAILADNALFHTPAGGNIAISVIKEKHNIFLSVSDTGSGILPEHLGKIFDRFYQPHSHKPTESCGSGLGLAIALWIAKQHGGTISVTSHPDKGSQFTVTLPLPEEKNTLPPIFSPGEKS